jgi:hypothetical protein
MPMITRLCLIAMLAASSAQVAQPPAPTQPRTPPRDTSASDKKATAAIRGKVTSAENGRPLRRAQVRLTAPELTQARTTSTNPQGTFEFTELPAGRYTISVSRNGHLSLQYGQRRPGEPPKPLQIVEGQVLERLDFSLPRAGVISGRVTDETGDAYAGVGVWPMQAQFFQGRKRLVPVGPQQRTDDTGQYRLVGLVPGDYIVMAQTQETWTVEGQPRRVFAYAPSYYGATASAADAQRVRVGVGSEVGAVDITMMALPASTISGTALGSDGLPLAGGNVSLSLEVTGPNGGSYMGGGDTTIAADGSWRLRDVPPGEFQLRARSVARDKAMEIAEMTISVQGDMEGVVLVADGGGTITGKVVTDDDAPLPEARRLYVSAQTTVPGRRPGSQLVGDDNGVVRSDGAFMLKGIAGPSMIRLNALPRGWAVRQIDIAGKDYVDTPLELRSGREVEGVRLVITNKFPAVTGQITDDKGQPAEGTVLLFPSDSAKWLEPSGTLRSSRPDQSGTFRFELVRPGEYLAVALDYVQQWQINDPEFLESLREKATAVKLEEGSNRQVSLTLR